MKALVLHDVGKISVEEVDKPFPKAGEVLLKVMACGICGSDIPRAYKDGAHAMPMIIGHEFAGVVEECGESVDKSWMGKRVGVFPLIPCKECECCKNNKYEMCKDYSYLGSRRDGGFAEYVTVPEWNLIELPERVSFEQAAMLEPMAVAVHAIRRVRPTSEDSVVIMGLGTIGLLVTMLLLDMGISNVFTIGNKESQKRFVMELGVPEAHYFDGSKDNAAEWIIAKTNFLGADTFFECIGKNESLKVGINAAAPSGKICTVGNPHTDMELTRDEYWKILRNQLTVTGTWNSSFMHDIADDWSYVISRLQGGTIQPEKFITHKFGLEEIVEGFEIMRDKKEEYVKVMGENRSFIGR
ncbi:galactitol-1-phosphate 5-dehydrogenase [Pseudobutyrivibrio xylanivorans]|uniref:Galactitol-1-phosphate 5-dehydrogenase n=1 Tax=Pseudobutyrivibrio xylanivorans TaxID=185007 RepID=A0A5P6VUT5_PSEXY|nr:galactitol-1-phosphate 5-dehydrogenase [Pseudobutyrivibrio xylanivorans]QFJ55014.1 galactitol-1-phosphate 5-dehydrogenase [Pseudobutyrivibrio xylanivorans]